MIDPRPSRPRSFRGFTLLEVIVVLVILGLLTTMIVPRLTSTRKQEFELFVSQVGDLLMMFAQRDNLGRTPVGLLLETNGESAQLEIVVLDDRSSDRADWRIDPMVRPVELPHFVLPGDIAVFADGEQVDITNWTLGHVPGDNRPALEIVLRDSGGRLRAALTLSPHGVTPMRRDEQRVSGRPVKIDLDAEGRSREDW